MCANVKYLFIILISIQIGLVDAKSRVIKNFTILYLKSDEKQKGKII